ncbi:hypothetical protein GGR42_000829 [Saonia flava]|uniref:DUF7793 domain-containing protein n=1 Tax=Saonia flava TaxID=523696 RepID=A0A846QT24_9FLAO|nr:hypothetical protein [Saonia flava]NJB70367.1 hypothetical protein [Saonia flava]
MEEKINLNHTTFWTKNNGILFCKITKNIYHKLDYKMAGLYLRTIATLSHGVPIPLLIDLRDVKGTFSIEAAQLLSKKFNDSPLIISEAYVVNSLAIKLLIRSYKRIYNTSIPYEIFSSMSMAKEYSLKNKIKE